MPESGPSDRRLHRKTPQKTWVELADVRSEDFERRYDLTDKVSVHNASPSLEERWNTELDKRGIVVVAAFLANNHFVGQGELAEFKLFVAGLQNPTKSYVERWLARKEAEAAQLTEAVRRRSRNLKIAMVIVVLALFALGNH
jgi:hypothetical protein